MRSVHRLRVEERRTVEVSGMEAIAGPLSPGNASRNMPDVGRRARTMPQGCQSKGEGRMSTPMLRQLRAAKTAAAERGTGVILSLERCGEVIEELERLQRLCKKQEDTIQRYEDALLNGDDDDC